MGTELSLRQCYDAQKYHESMVRYCDEQCKLAQKQSVQRDVDSLVQYLEEIKIPEAGAWGNDAGHRGQKANLLRLIAAYQAGDATLDEIETIINRRMLHLY